MSKLSITALLLALLAHSLVNTTFAFEQKAKEKANVKWNLSKDNKTVNLSYHLSKLSTDKTNYSVLLSSPLTGEQDKYYSPISTRGINNATALGLMFEGQYIVQPKENGNNSFDERLLKLCPWEIIPSKCNFSSINAYAEKLFSNNNTQSDKKSALCTSLNLSPCNKKSYLDKVTAQLKKINKSKGKNKTAISWNSSLALSSNDFEFFPTHTSKKAQSDSKIQYALSLYGSWFYDRYKFEFGVEAKSEYRSQSAQIYCPPIANENIVTCSSRIIGEPIRKKSRTIETSLLQNVSDNFQYKVAVRYDLKNHDNSVHLPLYFLKVGSDNPNAGFFITYESTHEPMGNRRKYETFIGLFLHQTFDFKVSQ